MNLYDLTSITSFASSAFLGIFVYLKNKNNPLNRAYALLSIAIFMWVFGSFNENSVSSHAQALFWDKFVFVGAAFAPILGLRFLLILTEKKKQRKTALTTFYLLSIVMLLFNLLPNLRPLLVKDIQPGLFFKYIAIPGPVWFFLYLPYFLSCVAYCAYLVLERMGEKISAYDRAQLNHVIVSTTCISAAGIMYLLLPLDISITRIDKLLVILFNLITTYAIVRHHFMDIEVIIRKSFVFAGMFIFAFGVFVITTLIVSHVLGAGSFISLAISSIIIIMGLSPLESLLIDSTDKFLFQKKYEYKQILKAFIDEVITVLSLDQIFNSTLELLNDTIHPYTAGIFILNKAEGVYQLYSAQGIQNKDTIFSSSSQLITFFKQSQQPAITKEIDGITGVSQEIQKEMQSIQAVICLPLMLHDDLIGFISLGRKKSDADYTKDDLDILSDLARTESVAVGNAQLLQEAAQAERRAAIGTMSAGIYHEIGNPLNIMATRIQLFKLARQKGLLNDKSNQEALDEAEAVLDECLRQSERISQIAKKLANFAKPGKEFKPELISVVEEMEEALDMAGHDLELDRINIKTEISSDPNKILADKHEMQQIFFNIIRNAGQAIEAPGTITLRVFTTQANKVHIEVEDTGQGIPETHVDRIFEPFFTTKGPNKGTGLGLSIVRQLVWKNKGEISFRSELGVGTAFILEFPRAVV